MKKKNTIFKNLMYDFFIFNNENLKKFCDDYIFEEFKISSLCFI